MTETTPATNHRNENTQQPDGCARPEGAQQTSRAELLENAPLATPVQQMFQGQSIFITGASGFIGRVLLEKLLRTYSGIERVYILLRTKKNQSPSDRLQKQLLNAPIFDKIRAMKNGEHVLGKIIVIPGDIAETNLGICDEHLRMMLEDKSLSIVFHSAATIKFDEPLRTSIKLNLTATKTIIDICKKLPNLVGLCHVSTAYVNSNIKDNTFIEERLYPFKDEPGQLINLANILDENLLQLLKARLVDERPNTYTYTKAAAEHLVFEEAAQLPVSIVRPSIVVAGWREPLEGWVDNLNGATGLVLAIGKGLLRTMYCDVGIKADIVPVDVVVNSMIASVYYTAKINNRLPPQAPNASPTGGSSSRKAPLTKEPALSSSSLLDEEPNLLSPGERCAERPAEQEQEQPQGQQAESRQTSQPLVESQPRLTHPIVHCNSGELNPLRWGDCENFFFPIVRKYPSRLVLRYPYGTFKTNKYHDYLTRLFVHFLPAIILDLLSSLFGKKQQLFSIYKKVHQATGALTHFCTQNYNFQTRNMKKLEQALEHPLDRQQLFMDIERINWIQFWDNYILGARRYVLKEPDETLAEARKSFRRAYWIEIGLRTLLVLLVAFVTFRLTFASYKASGMTEQSVQLI